MKPLPLATRLAAIPHPRWPTGFSTGLIMTKAMSSALGGMASSLAYGLCFFHGLLPKEKLIS
jgi:hypothetical protein